MNICIDAVLDISTSVRRAWKADSGYRYLQFMDWSVWEGHSTQSLSNGNQLNAQLRRFWKQPEFSEKHNGYILQ